MRLEIRGLDGPLGSLELAADPWYNVVKGQVAEILGVDEVLFDLVIEEQKCREHLWPPSQRLAVPDGLRSLTVLRRTPEFVRALQLLRGIFSSVPPARSDEVCLAHLFETLADLVPFQDDETLFCHLIGAGMNPPLYQLRGLLQRSEALQRSKRICRELAESRDHQHLLSLMSPELFIEEPQLCAELAALPMNLVHHLPSPCFADMQFTHWLLERIAGPHDFTLPLLQQVQKYDRTLLGNFSFVRPFVALSAQTIPLLPLSQFSTSEQCELMRLALRSPSPHLQFDGWRLGREVALEWARSIACWPLEAQLNLRNTEVGLFFLAKDAERDPDLWAEILDIAMRGSSAFLIHSGLWGLVKQKHSKGTMAAELFDRFFEAREEALEAARQALAQQLLGGDPWEDIAELARLISEHHAQSF